MSDASDSCEDVEAEYERMKRQYDMLYKKDKKSESLSADTDTTTGENDSQEDPEAEYERLKALQLNTGDVHEGIAVNSEGSEDDIEKEYQKMLKSHQELKSKKLATSEEVPQTTESNTGIQNRDDITTTEINTNETRQNSSENKNGINFKIITPKVTQQNSVEKQMKTTQIRGHTGRERNGESGLYRGSAKPNRAISPQKRVKPENERTFQGTSPILSLIEHKNENQSSDMMDTYQRFEDERQKKEAEYERLIKDSLEMTANDGESDNMMDTYQVDALRIKKEKEYEILLKEAVTDLTNDSSNQNVTTRLRKPALGSRMNLNIATPTINTESTERISPRPTHQFSSSTGSSPRNTPVIASRRISGSARSSSVEKLNAPSQSRPQSSSPEKPPSFSRPNSTNERVNSPKINLAEKRDTSERDNIEEEKSPRPSSKRLLIGSHQRVSNPTLPCEVNSPESDKNQKRHTTDDHTSNTHVTKQFNDSTKPPRADATSCKNCNTTFSLKTWKHHCRYCGGSFCNPCSNNEIELPQGHGFDGPQRVCDSCFGKLFQLQKG